MPSASFNIKVWEKQTECRASTETNRPSQCQVSRISWESTTSSSLIHILRRREPWRHIPEVIEQDSRHGGDFSVAQPLYSLESP